jgi:hypothetical protein
MALTASERLKRVRNIQRLAAEQRQAEQLRERAGPSHNLWHRIMDRRIRELRGWLMIEAEINECRRLEDEIEHDREQRLDDDWTRR